MANEVQVQVTSGSNSAKVSVGGSTIIATTTAASKIKIAKLEDNIGNLDKGEDGVIATGETLVYNAETEKWESVSLQTKVDESVETSAAVGDAIQAKLDAGATLDGGTFGS